MNDLFLFVRPPRPLWPFNSPATAFWPPLAFASLAAALRQGLPQLRVEILDAPALQMGWRTLQATLAARRPAFVGLGEEAVSCIEGLRLARLAKAGGARVIAGGCFFGQVAPEVLATGLVDVVVHGEGERTIVELIETLQAGEDPRRVKGISFRRETETVTTPPRALIEDLDTLPFPAYDLLPVRTYGRGSRNHPNLAAIELSRGCLGACNFCVLWRQMGRFRGQQVVPELRVKSPERLWEEIRVLTEVHDRRYLGWVDPCFNAHPRVPAELAERLLRQGLQVGQSAWMRTDALVRDAASGALGAITRAGLNEVYLGIERPDPGSLAALHKTSGVEEARRALAILRDDFPEVLAIGTFIYGLPEDTPASVRAIHRLVIELGLDQFFFIPLTPLPGTPEWRRELWDPSGERFRDYSFLPSGRTAFHAELEKAMVRSLLFYWPTARWRAHAGWLFSVDSRKRRVHRRLRWRTARFISSHLLRSLLGRPRDRGMLFPSWYET